MCTLQSAFAADVRRAVLRRHASQICTNCLGGQTFVHGKVPLWTTTIIENVLKELAVANGEAAKNGKQKFKYIGAWAARL